MDGAERQRVRERQGRERLKDPAFEPDILHDDEINIRKRRRCCRAGYVPDAYVGVVGRVCVLLIHLQLAGERASDKSSVVKSMHCS